ncbi:MAG: 3-hydroxyacyl-CoA dehydrogenase NAD-binding domain-containing protein [Gammaproteobacteria bacterium]
MATLTWNMVDAGTNILSQASMTAFSAAVDRAVADETVIGLVITSARKDFLAGADISMFTEIDNASEMARMAGGAQAMIRDLETCGKPVVAAIHGTALGGGLELCLGCHHRVAADNPKTRIGLVEVTIGVIPGAGGTQRLPRLIGIKNAVPLMAEGKRIKVSQAVKLGIVDQVVPPEQLLDTAKQWILDGGKAGNPWDQKGFTPPGGDLTDPGNQDFMAVANAMLREQSKGNYPAPLAVLAAVHDSINSPIDVGLEIEAKYFGRTATGKVAQNMIRTLFFGMQAANKLKGRPKGFDPRPPTQVAVLGAGLMGSGIAHACATRGLKTILLDATQEQAERGKAGIKKLLDREVDKGRLSEEKRDGVLALVTATADYSDLAGTDLVVEAVFESREVKAEVTAKVAEQLGDDIVFGSNTSTLPITGLAETWRKPENFIGIHFFSPVHRMALVEVILGEKTSEQTLAATLDFVKAIGKTPIVVNDARGFYTSRVVCTYCEEGMAMLTEGVKPALIENAGVMAGMPLGPLSLADEVQIGLLYKVRKQWEADLGDAFEPTIGWPLVKEMVEKFDRTGKGSGKGFYDYSDGKRLWNGLEQHYPVADQQPDVESLKKRLLYAQAIDAARCLEDNVVTNVTDADIGSILGWGFPPWAGGVISLIETVGIETFVTECQALAAEHGARFEPPALLVDMASEGRSFHPA